MKIMFFYTLQNLQSSWVLLTIFNLLKSNFEKYYLQTINKGGKK